MVLVSRNYVLQLQAPDLQIVILHTPVLHRGPVTNILGALNAQLKLAGHVYRHIMVPPTQLIVQIIAILLDGLYVETPILIMLPGPHSVVLVAGNAPFWVDHVPKHTVEMAHPLTARYPTINMGRHYVETPILIMLPGPHPIVLVARNAPFWVDHVPKHTVEMAHPLTVQYPVMNMEPHCVEAPILIMLPGPHSVVLVVRNAPLRVRVVFKHTVEMAHPLTVQYPVMNMEPHYVETPILIMLPGPHSVVLVARNAPSRVDHVPKHTVEMAHPLTVQYPVMNMEPHYVETPILIMLPGPHPIVLVARNAPFWVRVVFKHTVAMAHPLTARYPTINMEPHCVETPGRIMLPGPHPIVLVARNAPFWVDHVPKHTVAMAHPLTARYPTINMGRHYVETPILIMLPGPHPVALVVRNAPFWVRVVFKHTVEMAHLLTVQYPVMNMEPHCVATQEKPVLPGPHSVALVARNAPSRVDHVYVHIMEMAHLLTARYPTINMGQHYVVTPGRIMLPGPHSVVLVAGNAPLRVDHVYVHIMEMAHLLTARYPVINMEQHCVAKT
jgi:hypothetical protein